MRDSSFLLVAMIVGLTYSWSWWAVGPLVVAFLIAAGRESRRG